MHNSAEILWSKKT